MPCAVLVSLFLPVSDSCRDAAPAGGGGISRSRRNQRWCGVGIRCNWNLDSGHQAGRQAGGWLLYAPANVVAEACLFVKSTNCEAPVLTMTMTTPLNFFPPSAAAGEVGLTIQPGEPRRQHPARIPERGWCRRKQQMFFQVHGSLLNSWTAVVSVAPGTIGDEMVWGCVCS